MDAATLVADAAIILNVAQLAIKAGIDMVPFIQSLYQLLVQKQALTDAQRAALAAQETALRAQLDVASIPADQP